MSCTNSRLYMLFLDWQKAFDKLSTTALLSALSRLGIPTSLLQVIEDIYTDTMFNVRDNGFSSSTLRQSSGIRQGCPLSPYLFVIFMTILFHDAEQEVGTTTMERTMDLVDFSNIRYADDTFLVGNSLGS